MRSSERSTTVSTDDSWQVEAARVNEQLREAHRHKDEFVAPLAHELRNPLAPILTSAWGRAKDRDSAAAAGFDAHLTKPAESDQVVALLKQWLATARCHPIDNPG